MGGSPPNAGPATPEAASPETDLGDSSDEDHAPEDPDGAALPHRTQMEQLFGRDLGDVVAHTGEGDALAPLGARAAAQGNEVAFADAAPDQATVAHEVTHVVQQDQAG